jgi:hypothetical protein
MTPIHKEFIDQLRQEHTLTPEAFERLESKSRYDLFSVFWELKILLYGGVLMVSTGLSILVYKNIDTIGHQAILALIALLTVSGYAYCFRHNALFSWQKTNSPNILFDYVLLLAALCLLTFIGYLQYQYNVFGNRYGLATFIPMVILFLTAYYFDHIGILSLAITNLAAWAGIAVTPKNLVQMNDWADDRLIYTGIALGLFLLAVGYLGKKKEIKGHFEFTYKNFGTHTLFIALVCGMVRFENYDLLWFLPIAAFAYYTYRDALRNRSFYFLLVLIAYAYGSASYLLLKWVTKIPGIASIMEYLTAIYTIISTLFLVRFLMKMNKKLHK